MLLVHVENGSTAAGLASLSAGQPKLFGEHRLSTPFGMSVSGEGLVREVEQSLKEVLRHTSEVAARIRTNEKVAAMGKPQEAAVFLSAPWGRPNLAAGVPDFLPDMQERIQARIHAHFGALPISFYTAAGKAAFGTRSLMSEEPCLVCMVTGEVTELMHLDHEGVRAHATMPLGSHALLRTLRTHGGLSAEEARSAARLPFSTERLREPFSAAAAQFGAQFQDAAQALIAPGEVVRVIVIAEEPLGEWFARALESQELSALFPNGGTVRALRPEHATAHMAAHAERPDIPLMLATLFVDNHFNRI